ncbi:DsbA family protein [Saccharopolyspora sp. NFXS83]|uniref:2-hydroxychromene-2-carboxylate isomerase n=1 Tax=Saccharopolyspora sp. NFXS83 TaxID=2993560 RepID=UPI00224A9B32|nr:DsbA family protein [Saccharopolyspora sp. NFXS83]MCX2732050.1 DsbA family protein [Saccharopolyspora sp. NFXS83]
MSTGRAPRFYFSLRSPYSWLAYREIRERHPGLVDRLDWIPFWEPDERSTALLAERGGRFPYAAMSRAKHLYVLQDVARLAKARGLVVAWPVDRDPVWEVAHLPYFLALRAGRGHDYISLVYRARWEEGRDVGDPAVIAEIGAELGLDPARVAGAVDDEELRAEGIGSLLRVCREGAFGVPFFIAGREKFWGLDRLELFLAALPGGAEPAAVPFVGPESGWGTVEGGHAGGCG